MIFLLKIIFKKVLRNRLFSLWRRHPVLELQFVLPLRVTPVCFATQRLQIAVEWLRKGFSLLCIILQYCLLQLRVVNRIFVAAWRLRVILWHQMFLRFGADDFPFNIPWKSAPKSYFFRFGAEIRFWSCNLHCRWMAASRFLAAAAACVICVAIVHNSIVPWEELTRGGQRWESLRRVDKKREVMRRVEKRWKDLERGAKIVENSWEKLWKELKRTEAYEKSCKEPRSRCHSWQDWNKKRTNSQKRVEKMWGFPPAPISKTCLL